jgi:hypothetical protein
MARTVYFLLLAWYEAGSETQVGQCHNTPHSAGPKRGSLVFGEETHFDVRVLCVITQESAM